MSRFRSLVLDADSTLAGIEGIDWLAARRGGEMAAQVAALTAEAMAGEAPLESLYGRRLDLVHPDRREVAALGEAYRAEVAPGAREAIGVLRKAGIVMHVVSGGLREALLPFVEWLGFAPGELHAVGISFGPDGGYAGWERGSPLATSGGKGAVLRALALPAPTLAVGDGATDLALRSAGATFAAFTGFVRRDAVVAGADHVIERFDQLPPLVMS